MNLQQHKIACQESTCSAPFGEPQQSVRLYNRIWRSGRVRSYFITEFDRHIEGVAIIEFELSTNAYQALIYQKEEGSKMAYSIFKMHFNGLKA